MHSPDSPRTYLPVAGAGEHLGYQSSLNANIYNHILLLKSSNWLLKSSNG